MAAVGADSLGFFPQAAHPLGMLGVELTHVVRPRFSLVQPLELSYLHHRQFARGPAFDTGLTARWHAKVGFTVDGGLTLGAQHMVVAGPAYTFTDGKYQRGDRGRTSARLKLAVGLGFDFTRKTQLPLWVFARYQQLAFAPFAPKNGLPAMGRAQVLLGFAIPLGDLS